jgi:hypothetical protein
MLLRDQDPRAPLNREREKRESETEREMIISLCMPVRAYLLEKTELVKREEGENVEKKKRNKGRKTCFVRYLAYSWTGSRLGKTGSPFVSFYFLFLLVFSHDSFDSLNCLSFFLSLFFPSLSLELSQNSQTHNNAHQTTHINP